MDQNTRKALRPRIHGTTARTIGIAILSGEFAPGHAFLGEIEQAEALGISRTAYREAIRIVAAKGLVDSRPKAGTRVNPRAMWNLLDPDVLAWMFEGEPSELFIRDLFELRGVVEPAAVGFAAHRREQRHLDAMRAALDEMARHTLSTPEGQAADQRFHRAILDATGNEAMHALATTVGAAVHWTTEFKRRKGIFGDRQRDPVPEHERVYEAIAKGDASAARAAMNALLELALHDMGIEAPSRRRKAARAG